MAADKETIGLSDLSRLKRLADIVKDAIFGIALFAGAFPVLWTIEGSMIDERAEFEKSAKRSEIAASAASDHGEPVNSIYQESMETQIAEDRRRNTIMTWSGRALGFAMLTFGLLVLTPPLAPAWERIRGLNKLWERGPIAFSLGLAFGFAALTVLLRWLWAHVFIAIGLGVIAAGWFIIQRRRQARATVDVADPADAE